MLTNGAIWRDTDGNIIHAHGGHMLFAQGYYYWYGENRTNDTYVSVYRSTDLMHWEYRGDALTTGSKTQSYRVRTDTSLVNARGGKINIERPKVLYNGKTGKYVMWMHVENGIDYHQAACGVAVSDTPDGAFTYLGCFNPFGEMSRDCTLFQEEDGSAYFISAARDNADLVIYRLSEDYLNIDVAVQRLFQGEYREAPALVKREGIYYLFTSFCTGWDPNQCRYATAKAIEGPWSMLTDIGDATTFDTQPAFFLTVQESGNIYYVSDRWNGKDYHDSRYVILPLTFDDQARPQLSFTDRITIV